MPTSLLASFASRVRLGTIAGVVFALGAAASSASAQNVLPVKGGRGDQAVVARLDADIAAAVKAWKTAGLAVSIVRNDSVLLSTGYGLREIGKPTPVDADTRFAIGSTTKAMTSLALAMLVDEGKVRWDAPVIEYLPAFKLSDPWVTRELTVRDILTHRAGLGNADLLWTGTDFSAEEILRRVGTVQPAYSFRAGWIYQNIMYAVAGAVVEAASGKTWDEFLEQRIFAPLGMNSTITRLSKVEGQPNVASPHGVVNDSIRLTVNRAVDPVAAAGSVWSSVNDMAKWMRFVLDSGRVNGKRLVSEVNFRAWISPQVVADPNTYPALALSRPHFFLYGLGWFLQDYNGQAVAMHTGSINGMSAIIGLIPDKRLGVYVLANTDHVELRHAIMYEVFDRLGGAAGTPKRDWSADLLALFARENPRPPQPPRVADTKPTLPLASYVATYRNPTYGDVVITLNGETLHARFGSSFDGDLTHSQYDTFRARWSGRGEGSITFRPDGNGRILALQLQGNLFTRIAPSR